MNTEQLSRAHELENRHRNLVHELKAWQDQSEPLRLTSVPHGVQTPVPIALWLPYRAGVLTYLDGLITANRKAFEAL